MKTNVALKGNQRKDEGLEGKRLAVPVVDVSNPDYSKFTLTFLSVFYLIMKHNKTATQSNIKSIEDL